MHRPLAALLLSALALALAADRQTVAGDKPAETLRHAVNGRFLIGTAVTTRQLDNSATAELVARQFNCLTAENEFKPQSLQPQPGKFRFDAADKVVTRITTWGTQDGASWLNGGFGGRRTNYPLLFDRDLKPKPAFKAVLDALAAP